MATYEEILKQIQDGRKDLDPSSISVSEKSPQLEALMGIYGPELANLMKAPIDQKKAGLLPQAAGQNKLQQEAIQMQLKQSGYGQGNFDPTTGAFTGIQGASATNPYGNTAAGGQATGIAGYQPYLDNATNLAGAASNLVYDPLTKAARPAAGSAALGQASQDFNSMSAAAAAGQGASDPYTQAAQGYVGPNSYQQFQSPYQQEVIDATMAQMQSELNSQQSQLGASAGNAFGGGRFGVAEGQLASSGALGKALAAGQLRQSGYQNSQQAAANAYQQQMGMGTQAMNQANQNVNMYGQAGQSQLGQAQAEQASLQNQLAQLGGAASQQQGLAALQPQLFAQNMASIGQMGAQQQAQAQALLDTTQQGNKMQAYEPYDRLGFFGSQLTGLLGGYPQGTTYSSAQQQQPSPTAGILGLLTGAGSLATGVGAMMGANRPIYGA